MPSSDRLQSAFACLRNEGERLAGGLNDLAQRATVYHHLFEHSGRNHVFPVIAAHGAMWARGYFRFGMRIGWCCSWQYAMSRDARHRSLEQLNAFADEFRDINRRVCVETYATYHFTEQFGDHPDAARFVPSSLLDALNRCHVARRLGRELSDCERREVFLAFFENEQETVVGPSIRRAIADFEWPLMRVIALRPLIRFAYFPRHGSLVFRNFADTNERIEKGLRAFDLAARAGWNRVEASLRDYAILPDAFFASSTRHFATVREAVLAGC